MHNAFVKLNKEFERIKQKGYIKGIYNSPSSIGRTFEQELGIIGNNKSLPDYYGIELKTRKSNAKSLINLFNAFPDGREKNELLRLRDTYGYPYKKDRKYKCLYIEAYANKVNKCGIKYYFKLDIDTKNERIYLSIYNNNKELIEKKIFWSFSYLKRKLKNKLSFLTLIHSNNKIINGWGYHEYYDIKFYVLKNFRKFLKLLEDGKIKMYLEINVRQDKVHYGQVHYNGCSFQINESNIEELFYKYDLDTGKLL